MNRLFATLNGVVLHYTDEGVSDGESLVFINSLGSDLRIWDDVVARLAAHYRIVRYDKRGHGLSDGTPAPYAMRDHSADLLALLDHLQMTRAVLIGISVGGMIAQYLAAWHPERVGGLVLCDTGAKIGTVQSWNERIDAVQKGGIAGIADAVLARWLTSAFAQAQPSAYRGWRNMMAQTSLPGYVGTCAALRDADLTESTRTLQTPTLVLCGAADPTTTPALNQALAGLIAGAQFELIDNAAHLPCIEQPAPMAAKIAAFLDSVSYNRQALSRHDRGMQVRRAVLGDAYVDRAEANKNDFDADFQHFITETAWGNVWARAGLDRRVRHLLTIAMMATLGKEHELAMHIRATPNTGVTQDEVKEVLLQVAVYAGVPAANSAMAVAKKIYADF